jgi:hypothetical protein
MDATVAVALIGVIGTLVGTLGATLLTNRAASEREETQWRRQQRDQFGKELLAACEKLGTLVLLQVTAKPPDDEGIARAVTRVRMLAPKPISDQAWSLYTTSTQATRSMKQAETLAEKHEAAQPLADAHDSFVSNVRKALEGQE